MIIIMYRPKESYAHYYAKEIVSTWINDKWDRLKDSYNTEITFGHLSWKIDRRYGSGVKLEYPVYKRAGAILGLSAEWATYPTANKQLEPIMVFDIVISELGKPKYAIEIVHSHVCTESKRLSLKNMPTIEVYELAADWVLSQLKGITPSCIPLVRIPS
jgi:hypothetical protein